MKPVIGTKTVNFKEYTASDLTQMSETHVMASATMIKDIIDRVFCINAVL